MLYVTGFVALICLIVRILYWIRERRRRMPPPPETPLYNDAVAFLRELQEKSHAQFGARHKPFVHRDRIHDRYIIRNNGPDDGDQLLDIAQQPVFDEHFVDITYHKSSRLFICRRRSGARIFSAANGQCWDARFQHVFIDQWGNHTYRDDDNRYGVLDENFQPAFDGSFEWLQGMAKGFFSVREAGGLRILDRGGNTLLDHLSRIDDTLIDGRVLVVRDDTRHALFTLQTGALLELRYHQVFVLHRPGSNPRPRDSRYYLAIDLQDETIPGKTILRRKRTVLNAAGTPLFDTGFDDLSAMCVSGRYYFIAGHGDCQLLDALTEDATGPGGILSGTMRYALYDEDATMLIPPDYTAMEFAFDGDQLIVTLGGEPRIFQWQDEYIGEEHLSWEMRGGHSGVLNLAGDVVIPPEWASIEAEYFSGPLCRMYVARKTPQGQAMYFGRSGMQVPAPDPA